MAGGFVGCYEEMNASSQLVQHERSLSAKMNGFRMS